MNDFSFGDVVEVGPAFRMGEREGQGKLVADGYEGTWTVVGFGKLDQNLALVRGAVDAKGLDRSDCELWMHRGRCEKVA